MSGVVAPGEVKSIKPIVTLPRATAQGRELIENTNVVVSGKKGFGKTAFVEEVLVKNKKRLLVLDTLCKDYGNGKFAALYDAPPFTDFTAFKKALVEKLQGPFRFVLRCPGKEEAFLSLFRVDPETQRSLLTDTTFAVEEITQFMDSNSIHPALMSHLQYGRHSKNNLVGVTRSPFEISTHMRRQSDLFVSFRQDEENDLKYYRAFNAEKADQLRDLKVGEYLVMRGTDKELVDFIGQP